MSDAKAGDPRTFASDGAALAKTAAAVDVRRCVRCGEIIEGRYWMVQFPHGAHEACVDWSQRAFPFVREIDVLRLLARRAGLRVRPALLRAAERLTALRRRWPVEAPSIFDEGRSIIDAVRPLLAELDHRDRMRL